MKLAVKQRDKVSLKEESKQTVQPTFQQGDDSVCIGISDQTRLVTNVQGWMDEQTDIVIGYMCVSTSHLLLLVESCRALVSALLASLVCKRLKLGWLGLGTSIQITSKTGFG